MPGFDALAPDQKAVLQLLLKQRKSYGEIAGLLRLESTSVRERALDALDALGADDGDGPSELTSERQDELADHLLRQQTDAAHAATRSFLATSAPGWAWAARVRAELEPVGGDALPELPAAPTATAPRAETATSVADTDAPRAPHERSSKFAGALLLLAVLAAVGLGAFLITRGDAGPPTSADATVTAPSAPTRCALPTGTTGTTGIDGAARETRLPQQQINLLPPNADAKQLGYGILAEGSLAIQAEKLPQSRFGYKLWLWNSPTEAIPLGFVEYNRPSKRFAGAIGGLPSLVDGCGSLVLTRERSKNATTPGPVVLQGAIRRQ